jgi:hypothetical protein
MAAVDQAHAGVASGVNNAVARVAGLVAIAVFGVLLARTFDARARSGLAELHLNGSTRAAIDRELPKMAGAEVQAVQSIDPASRTAVREVIDGAFLSAFRLVLIAAAVVALAAAAVGASIR